MRRSVTSVNHERSRRTRIFGRTAVAVTATLTIGCLGGQAIAASAAPTSCAPHSGLQLAQHQFTAAEISQGPDFNCADLRGTSFVGLRLVQIDFVGADLSDAKLAGVDLSQADLSGAKLTNADLAGAELVQATVIGANFTGSDLTGADLGQAEANDAVFTGANLTEAELTQTDLTDAVLNETNLSGASFIQATLTGAQFQDVTGVVRWDLYIAAAALALLLLLVISLVVGALRRNLHGPALVRTLTFGLLGRVTFVLGLHFLVAGMVGILGTTLIGPIVEICSGPQCAVGVERGIQGPFIGVGLIFASTLLMAVARKRPLQMPPVTFPPSFAMQV